jgi:transcriptional regulator with XRE-family HTH domain
MLDTQELLSVFKKANGNCSNYRAAQLLGVTRQAVSKWFNGHGSMNDDIAARAAQLADLDESYVVACINAERHREDGTFPIWAKICDRLEPRRHAA